MTPPKIAVLGSVNLDFVIRTARLPVAGETVSEGHFFTTPGGKGGNQALAARKLGADVTLYASVGDDPYADAALENLKAEGVDVSQRLIQTEAKTGAAFINVADDGENQIAVASGANALYTPDLAPKIDADWIIAQLEINPETILKAAEQSEAKLCINAAPVKPLPEALLARTDLLIVNEIEHSYYAEALAAHQGLVALTLGSKGAVLLENGTEIAKSPAPTVGVVDTTGAGDCFVAALTVFFAEGQTPSQALNAACICGALATTQLGAQAGTPRRADVLASL
ncbi:MAG: ribokinase [Pseudomonadota bacterium]